MQYLFLFLMLLGTNHPPHYHQFTLDPNKDSHHYILDQPEQTNLRNFYLYVHSGNLEIHGITAKLKDGASIYFAVGQALMKDQYTPSFRVHGQAIQSLTVDYEVKAGSPKAFLELVGSEN
jgi:hypothetical protein